MAIWPAMSSVWLSKCFSIRPADVYKKIKNKLLIFLFIFPYTYLLLSSVIFCENCRTTKIIKIASVRLQIRRKNHTSSSLWNWENRLNLQRLLPLFMSNKKKIKNNSRAFPVDTIQVSYDLTLSVCVQSISIIIIILYCSYI